MTFNEARQRGIKAIRKRHWNETARLELPPEGMPWCTLYDSGTETHLLACTGHANDGLDDWEAVPDAPVPVDAYIDAPT